MNAQLQHPTPETLTKLRKLCGNDAGVIALLAKQFGLPVEQVAPIVKAWLAELPPPPPPSRQRSAPPQLDGPAVHLCGAAAAMHPLQRAAAPPPPASAPVKSGSAASVLAAMRALDNRMNRHSNPNAARGVPPTVPEDSLLFGVARQSEKPEAPRGVDEDFAAAAYLQREALVHGRGKLAPNGGGKGDAVRSTWMTRATAPVSNYSF